MSQITDLIKEAHETAKEKGWWDNPKSFLECCALVHSEVSEAVEHYRAGCQPNGYAMTEELADVVIRILDMAGHWHVDLEEALLRKIESNKSRPHRHGDKVC